jgi:putative addiction module killer protein/probable addiction module antidote protein
MADYPERYEIREYLTEDGRSPFAAWLNALRDRRARARIDTRLARVRLGNLGDYAAVGEGVHELRIFYGPGYRVYFGFESSTVVALLCGGQNPHNGVISPPRKRIGTTTGVETMMRSRLYKEGLLERLKDPQEAAAYLDAALEDGDTEVFLLALRDVAEARLGGMTTLAQQTGLNRETLYRTLSEKGNPELASLDKLLHAVGLRLAVEVDRG